MASLKLGLIGGGNMAAAVIAGLQKANWPAEQLQVAEPDSSRRDVLEKQFAILTSAQNKPVAAWAEVLVFAVKPGVFPQVARDLADTVRDDCLIISLAAGVRSGAIARWFGREMPTVRVMPNTPALINKAVCGVFATPGVDAAGRDITQTVLESLGSVIWVEEESLIDSITGISGSGPAYFFRLMELLEQAAIEHGLTPDQARQSVIDTALGAAQLGGQSRLSLAQLREQVTSPGGTTQAALEKFAELGFAQSVREGVAAAVKRAQELGDESEKE